MSYDRRSFVAMLALMSLSFKAKARDAVAKTPIAPQLPVKAPLEAQKRMINDFNENPLGNGLTNSSYLECDLASAELKTLISQKESIEESRIFLGAGARYIIFEICSRARASGFSHFIMPVPDYGTAARFAQENGLKVTRVPNSSDEAAGILERIEKVITPKSIIYISNPGLPYGVHLSTDKISQLITRHPDCLFIVDEAYLEFFSENFRELSSKNILNKHSNLIIIRTFSKAYGLAGHRIAYAMTDKNNIQKFLFAYRDSRLISQDSSRLAKMALSNSEHLAKTRDYIEKTKFDFYTYVKTKNHLLQIIDTKCVYITFSTPITNKNRHLLKSNVLESIWEKTRYDYWTVKSKTRVEAYISVTTLEKMKADFDLVQQILEGSYVV